MTVYLVPFGFLEFGAFGAQYQLNEHYAIGVKVCAAFLGEGYIFPLAGKGGGMKVSYYFDRTGYRKFLAANAINFELSYLDPDLDGNQGRTYRGCELELTAGHDGIAGGGLGFLWAAGIAIGSVTSRPPLFFPALKIGVHYDF